MLTEAARRFLLSRRVAHLATADAQAVPHVVPVCFALEGPSLYVTVDAKPKTGRRLRRLENLAANPACCLVADRWDEDWRRLGWVMLHGRAEVLAGGAEHDLAQALLRDRYAQYRAMELAALPVIAMRVTRVRCWGDLSPGQEEMA
jgi:PPOX class probable F420-dependent enzyme